jgi:penicillin amidase
VAQVEGEFAIDGLSAPVRVVRDRWGVPHIYAQSQDDLFVAQGFVQAQDRLFQMDLWRRASQGRLAQVLGPNFTERDIMTRRMQYRGDRDTEWASYGADTRAIATSFVRGINAWVAAAHARPPEEFVLAGWKPEYWSAADVLNRTDAFLASGDAIDEVGRRAFSHIVADAIRRTGTQPFLIGLAGRLPDADDESASPAPTANAVSREVEAARQRPGSGSRVSAARGAPLSVFESGRLFDHPSSRYVVHLHAPGWNVIGAARPWLPGVAIGHNERVAWGMAPYEADTQDLFLEPLGAPSHRIVKDRAVIAARKPFEYESEYTPRGVVVAQDREKKIAFAVRWSGAEPGAAGELASLALNRARNWDEFRQALARWKMPVRQFVYVDVEGNLGSHVAGLIPMRRGEEWQGFVAPDDLPHTFNPSSGDISVKDDRPRPPVDASATFAHVLGINQAARRRYNIGPLPRPGEDDGQLRASFDPSDWNRSRVVNAPGQSGSPSSAHFADLAALWSRGETIPLVFGDADVEANAGATLTLVPRRGDDDQR